MRPDPYPWQTRPSPYSRADLPRVEIVHDLPESEKTCPCGAVLVRIGEEVSEKLDIVPAKIQVIRHIRPKYACRACEGVEDLGLFVASSLAGNTTQTTSGGLFISPAPLSCCDGIYEMTST